MEESSIPPTPFNRGSKVLAAVGKQIIVYPYRSHLVVLKWHETGYSTFFIEHAHERVVAVVGVPVQALNELGNLVVTCGGDGFVRLWNLDTLTCLKGHNTHWTNSTSGKVPACDISWSPINPNIVFSLGSNNCLVVWRIQENVTTKYSIQGKEIHQVACSTHDDTVASIACSGGSVGLFKCTGLQFKLSWLRVFDNADVSDMAWQFGAINPIIAFTSERGKISFWDSNKMKCIKNGVLESSKQVKAFNNYNSTSVYYPLVWINKNVVCTRVQNSVVSIDVVKIIDQSCKTFHTSLHDHHRRNPFSIVFCSQNNLIWSAGWDKFVVGCDATSGEVVRSFTTTCGSGISVATSPHDPNIVAFGCGDGCFRIWNVKESTGKVMIENRQVKDKVMSVCWHPEDDVLFYGTSAGRVGKFGLQSSQGPSLLKSCSSKCVYWLCWGPPFFTTDNSDDSPTLILYAVSDKTIFTYLKINADEEPYDFGKELNLSSPITDLSWKPDYSFLAVGCKNGSIFILKPGSTAPVHSLHLQDSIQYLSWHPAMTSSDTDVSPYHNLLTCANVNRAGTITVFKVEEDGCSVVTVLQGHHDLVQSVAWNPHTSARLVSTSADCSVQVWDVLTGTGIANFSSPINATPLFAIWCPIDPDFIIAGSRESIIFTWRISAQSKLIPSINPEKLKRKPAPPVKRHKCELATAETTDANETKIPKDKKKERNDDTSLAKMVGKVDQPAVIKNAWKKPTELYEACYKLLKTPAEERSTLYSLNVLSTTSCDSANLQEGEPAGKSISDFFSDSSCAMIWQGRLKELIEQRMVEGKLSDQLVAMAASVSPRLWQVCCSSYARQLKAQDRFIEATHYHLAIREIREAVQALIDGKLYIEALHLIKLRLSKDDPLFSEVLKLYAVSLEENGHIWRATECLIYLGELEEAAVNLSKRRQGMAMSAAALAAKLSKKESIRLEAAPNALAYAISGQKESLIEEFAIEHGDLECIGLMHNVYKRLYLNLDRGETRIQPFFEDLEEGKRRPSEECARQILNINLIPQEEQKQSVSQWPIVKELSLACCTGQDRPRRVLRALKACETNQTLQHSICAMISPGLKPEGIFSVDSPLGVSLRAFLSLARIERESQNEQVTEDTLQTLELLSIYLLDAKAFDYHRAKAKLGIFQSRLVNEVNGEDGRTSDKKNISDERLKFVEERNGLVLSISRLEAERVAIPNPVAGFFALRTFYNQYPDNPTAQKHLEDITQSFLPLIK